MFRSFLLGLTAACGLLIAGASIGLPLLSTRGLFNVEAGFAILWIACLLASAHVASFPEIAGSALKAATVWNSIVAGLLLVGATFALLPALSQPFLSDDFYLVYGDPYATSMFYTAGDDGFYRPVGQFVMWVAREWLPLTPTAWGTWGLLLNLIVSALVGVLAARIGGSDGERPDKILGVWAAAIFLAHGAHPEAAIWVAGRFDVMASGLVLAGLLAALAWRRSDSWKWMAASVGFMLLAISTKEIAYGYPLLLALMFLLRPLSRGRAVRVLAVHACAAAAMLLFRFWMFQGVGGYASAGSGGAEILAVTPLHVVKVFFTRLYTVLLLPVNWSVWPDAVTLACIAAGVIALCFAAWRVPPRFRMIVFALGWSAVAAAPGIAQLLIGPDLSKTRLLYLPSVGFCILLGSMAARLATELGGRMAQVGLAAFFVAALQHNLQIWRPVGETVSNACAQAASIARARPEPLRFEGLPRSINGVYAFANGFPMCVSHFSGRPVEDFDNAEDNLEAEVPENAIILRWHAEGERFESPRFEGQPW